MSNSSKKLLEGLDKEITDTEAQIATLSAGQTENVLDADSDLSAEPPGGITIVVLNARNDEFVEGVKVTVGAASGVTGNVGMVVLDVPPGKYPYEAEKEGWKPASGSVDVAPKGNDSVLVKLEKILGTLVVTASLNGEPVDEGDVLLKGPKPAKDITRTKFKGGGKTFEDLLPGLYEINAGTTVEGVYHYGVKARTVKVGKTVKQHVEMDKTAKAPKPKKAEEKTEEKPPVPTEPPEEIKKVEVRSYVIELKAWIPHEKVVDPEEQVRVTDWLDTLTDVANTAIKAFPLAVTLEYEFESHYRGDNHAGYKGSYRVLATLQFDWDGHAISGVKSSGDYGDTHRDWKAEAWIEALRKKLKTIFSSGGSEKDRAKSKTWGKAKGNSFELGFSSGNPVVMVQALCPNIDSVITGTIAPNGDLTIKYKTDMFPSHGLKVSINGVPDAVYVLNDASGVVALGPAGITVITVGLTSQGNTGELNIAAL